MWAFTVRFNPPEKEELDEPKKVARKSLACILYHGTYHDPAPLRTSTTVYETPTKLQDTGQNTIISLVGFQLVAPSLNLSCSTNAANIASCMANMDAKPCPADDICSRVSRTACLKGFYHGMLGKWSAPTPHATVPWMWELGLISSFLHGARRIWRSLICIERITRGG